VTDDDELLTIGRFAHLTGLSQHALRHYDDVGLLVPAVVDA
jgi:DNA-binding transcriptional MerR regulator